MNGCVLWRADTLRNDCEEFGMPLPEVEFRGA